MSVVSTSLMALPVLINSVAGVAPVSSVLSRGPIFEEIEKCRMLALRTGNADQWVRCTEPWIVLGQWRN
jgi:hypothetical protein